MYGILRRLDVRPEDWDKVAGRIESGFVACMESMPGFCSHRLLDCGTGVLLSLGTFETEAALRHSRAQSDRWIDENILPGLVQSPVTIVGRVRPRRPAASDPAPPVGPGSFAIAR